MHERRRGLQCFQIDHHRGVIALVLQRLVKPSFSAAWGGLSQEVEADERRATQPTGADGFDSRTPGTVSH